MDPGLEARIEAAAATLRSGGVIAYPTETFYGLGALAADGAAVRRLARAKGRPDGKPLPLLAAELADVEAAALLDPAARRVAERLWPGPLTLVLAARPGLPAEVTAGTGTVGIRVPGSEIARRLARGAAAAIASTSANPAGGPPPARVEDLDPALRARLDAVLDAGPAPGGLASTVVALEDGRARLLRAGPIALDDVERVLRPKER